MIFWKSIRTVAPCRSLNGQSSSVRACRRNKAQQLILRLPECIEIAVQVDIGVAISIGYKGVLFYWSCSIGLVIISRRQVRPLTAFRTVARTVP